MHDIQSLIFQKVTYLPDASSLVILALGLLCVLQGFRFARFLVALICAGGGFLVGSLTASSTGMPPLVAGVTAIGLCGLAIFRFRAGLVIAAAFTGGALLFFLAEQLGARPNTVLTSGAVGLATGFSLIWVCPRSLPMLLTIVHGAGLLIVAFVAVTSALAPSLGVTFCDWATTYPLMTPAFMLMLCTLGYSVQANARQGAMETGGASELIRPRRLT